MLFGGVTQMVHRVRVLRKRHESRRALWETQFEQLASRRFKVDGAGGLLHSGTAAA